MKKYFEHPSWVFYDFLNWIGLTKSITYPPLEAFMKKYGSNSKALNIGAGKTTFQEFFPNQIKTDVEIRDGMSIDIIADAHDLSSIADSSFEVVICTEVLEHLHTPHLAIKEIERVLKSGGLLLLTTRFVFPLHGSPIDYYRFTRYGLEHLLRNFEIIEIAEDSGTMETMAILSQRIGLQCKTLWFKPFKLFWFFLALFFRFASRIITSEYSDGRYSVEEKNILSSGYLVAAKKK